MFGTHFKHVLVLMLLAGIAYSLPQVRDGLSDSFSSIYSTNQATVIESTNNIPETQYVELMPDTMEFEISTSTESLDN